jgi:hypothetical protein
MISLNDKYNTQTNSQVFFEMSDNDLKILLIDNMQKCYFAKQFLECELNFKIKVDDVFDILEKHSKIYFVTKMIKYLKQKNIMLEMIINNMLYDKYLLFTNNNDEYFKQRLNSFLPNPVRVCHLRIVA